MKSWTFCGVKETDLGCVSAWKERGQKVTVHWIPHATAHRDAGASSQVRLKCLITISSKSSVWLQLFNCKKCKTSAPSIHGRSSKRVIMRMFLEQDG